VTAVRIVVADDQPLVRAGIRRVVETDHELDVVGEAADGHEAVALTRALRPDVVLMDIRMPILDGIEATSRLVEEGTDSRIVILTTFGLDEYVLKALRAGASGFVLKEAPPEEILAAIHVVASGDALIAPAVTRAVIEELGRRPVRADLSARLDDLTPREREVLELIAQGLSNAEIASTLVVGEGTVKTHVAHVLAKLGVRDRVQAVVFAYEAGIV
jgi:DNA-binding NarL/FixJ family response regulator